MMAPMPAPQPMQPMPTPPGMAGMGQPQPLQPPPSMQGMAPPQAMQQAGAGGQGPVARGFGGPQGDPGMLGGPGMGGPQGPGMGSPGMGYDYDDRPRKSNVGPIVIIVLALLVLFGAAFGGIYVMLKDKGGAKGGAVAEDTVKGDDDGKATSTPGALTIQVTPSDAKVLVDDKPLSGASPFVTSVAPGKHKIVITHDAHLEFSTEVDVTEAGLNVPPITLQPKAVKLAFELVPAEATATILSGEEVMGTGSNGSQLTVVRKPNVALEVQVNAPGYTSLRQPVTFTGEPTQIVKVTLAKAAGEQVAKVEAP